LLLSAQYPAPRQALAGAAVVSCQLHLAKRQARGVGSNCPRL
jgi:hypothetical protein